jgi:hypothetical protein
MKADPPRPRQQLTPSAFLADLSHVLLGLAGIVGIVCFLVVSGVFCALWVVTALDRGAHFLKTLAESLP